jgi:hypothetical protein
MFSNFMGDSQVFQSDPYAPDLSCAYYELANDVLLSNMTDDTRLPRPMGEVDCDLCNNELDHPLL